ncbi:MAG TPA: DUF4112 domain-containing protein [Woeseiaceae bacterium]|nr:DUF4112 domain-containing protein [Woeseiaceae bacterium]
MTEVPPRRLKTIAYLMDESIRLPGGYRIGWDGIIGLVPGIGDVAGLAVSAYIIAESARLGASKSVLLRMSANAAIDAILGAIPVLGDLFDFTFKANRRNLHLLQSQLDVPQRTRRVSIGWLAVAGVVALLVLVAVLVLLSRLIAWLWNLVS